MMERLTERDKNGFVISGIETNAVNGCYDILDVNWLEKCLDRLAAYEDTALEPGRIAETIWRLWDYFDADREGRLIVLPCEDRIDRENLANRIERMVVRDDCLVGVSSGEKRITYAITSALRSEE